MTNNYEFPVITIPCCDDDHCTNRLSSLHFSSYHCTFWASLQVKTRQCNCKIECAVEKGNMCPKECRYSGKNDDYAPITRFCAVRFQSHKD